MIYAYSMPRYQVSVYRTIGPLVISSSLRFPSMATGGYSNTRRQVQRNCNSCRQYGEQKDAEYYCEECQEYMCSDCKEAHRRVSTSWGHKVTKVNIVSGTTSVLFSSDEMHDCEPCKTGGNDKEANHYCGICQEYLCGSCGYNHGKYKVSKDHVLTNLHGATHMGQTVPSQNIQDVILDLSPQSISKVSVKEANDEAAPHITGCSFLSSGELLLCDHENENIKIFNKSLTVSDSIQIVSRPWDIAVVDDKTAIVTMPNVKQLQYVDLVQKLSLGSRLSTKQRCFGIVVVNNLIYITCHGGPKSPGGDIRVLDLRGNELKTISINRDGSQFLRQPFYIAANREGNKLYVTDYDTNEILCISPSGNIINKLKDADKIAPFSVYVDRKDNLLVCRRDTDTVQVIAANGTKYKNLLTSYDGVHKPIGIAFRPADSTLIVGLDRNNEVLAVKLV